MTRRFYRKAIPANCHPLVAAIMREVNDRRIDFPSLGARAGVCPRTVAQWRIDRTPNLVNFVAVAEALGFEVRLERKSPTT